MKENGFVEHTWLTREDPFSGDWVFIEQILKDTKATVEAKTLFEHLQRACLRGENGHCINYRHHIDRLVRKPAAFENYCYKDDLFPTSLFRIAYDILRDNCSIRQASKEYLKILEMAAKEDESLVNEALRLLSNLEEVMSFEKVKQFIGSRQKAPEPTDVYIEPVDIHDYDLLLETPECVCIKKRYIVFLGNRGCEINCVNGHRFVIINLIDF